VRLFKRNNTKPKYTNLKYIPTHKIQEILNSNHCTGTDGADYGPVKHELEEILWLRQARQLFSDPYEEYEDYLDSQGVPPIPVEALL
jgi:hypothetical protein